MGDDYEWHKDFSRWEEEADPCPPATAEGWRTSAHRSHWGHQQDRVFRVGERERAIQRHPASDPLGLRSEGVDGDGERSGGRDWSATFALAFIGWCAAMLAVTLCVAIAGLMFG